jgi:hypothetical protein
LERQRYTRSRSRESAISRVSRATSDRIVAARRPSTSSASSRASSEERRRRIHRLPGTKRKDRSESRSPERANSKHEVRYNHFLSHIAPPYFPGFQRIPPSGPRASIIPRNNGVAATLTPSLNGRRQAGASTIVSHHSLPSRPNTNSLPMPILPSRPIPTANTAANSKLSDFPPVPDISFRGARVTKPSSGPKAVAHGSNLLKQFFPGEGDDGEEDDDQVPSSKPEIQPPVKKYGWQTVRPPDPALVQAAAKPKPPVAITVAVEQLPPPRRSPTPPRRSPTPAPALPIEIAPARPPPKEKGLYNGMFVRQSLPDPPQPHPVIESQVSTQSRSPSQAVTAEMRAHDDSQVDLFEDGAERPSRTRHADEFYQILVQVGEGTFGKVYKARNTATGSNVALKRIRMESERDGFPVTAMREIKLLQSLRHDNVIELHEMMVSRGMWLSWFVTTNQ